MAQMFVLIASVDWGYLWYSTAAVMSVSNSDQLKTSYCRCLPSLITDGLAISKMLQINLLCWWYRLPCRCNFVFNFWLNFELIRGSSVMVDWILRYLVANISASHTFLFVFPVYFDNNSLSFSFAFQILSTGISCLGWTCPYYLWDRSLWSIRFRAWIPRRVSFRSYYQNLFQWRAMFQDCGPCDTEVGLQKMSWTCSANEVLPWRSSSWAPEFCRR